MKIAYRRIILGTAVLLFAGALFYAFRPRPAGVQLARVVRGPLQETVEEDGRTRIRERYAVSAPLGGQLRRIELEPGDPVRAGSTLLATIDPGFPELLDVRTRAQLEARLRSADAQVQLSIPRIERARAANDLAQAELARAQALAGERAIARQELDRASEAARAAAEDVKAADYSRQIALFEREQVSAALLRATPQTSLTSCASELSIVSPIDGRVLRVFHEDAATVVAGTRLLELGDPEDLEAEIDVLSSDAVRIRPGARVLFEQWGGERALEGRVRLVEPAGFLKISALGVEEQRVNIIVDFVTPPDARRALGDAYRVEARIVVWEASDVLKVPTSALFRSGSEWAVFVARQGRAVLSPVQIGHGNAREREIVQGLGVGDEVLIYPGDKITDGVRISALPVVRR